MAEQRPPVSVAVRFLYMLYDWVNSPWTQPLPGNLYFVDTVFYGRTKTPSVCRSKISLYAV